MKKRLDDLYRFVTLAICILLVLPVAAVQIKDTAPQSYVVKKGDTLWGIASIFLDEPWLWPELWVNNTQISNPHLIYPGDTIVVSTVNGKTTFSINRDKPQLTLSPSIGKRVKSAPVNILAWETIAPFTKQHTFLTQEAYDALPQVLGNHDGNIRFASDDFILSQASFSPQSQYQIIRKQATIKDLDGETLGVQMTHISTASVVTNTRQEDTMLLHIDNANQEAKRGDRIASGGFEFPTDIELVPATSQRGVVVGDLHDHDLLGKYDVAILDLGEAEVHPGMVLGVYVQGPAIIDDRNPRYVDEPGAQYGGDWFNDVVSQPAMKVGELIIIKTFQGASYGLIIRSSKGIKRGFIVAHP